MVGSSILRQVVMVNDDDDDENTCVYAKSGVIISSLNERLKRLGWRLTGWCYFCNNVTSCLEIVPTWDTREDRQTMTKVYINFYFGAFVERKMKIRQN